MSLEVNILCRNYADDRVIPRFSRYLRDIWGWDLTSRPVPGADLYYLSGYFELPIMRKTLPQGAPLVAYFTHLEEEPPGNAKAKAFKQIAGVVDLRIATARIYADLLIEYGETVQINAPVERNHFTIPKRSKNRVMRAGFSGYTYRHGRKGEALASALLKTKVAKALSWSASGRGWPVPTKRYPWRDLPGFYQSLDILVIPALVEGVPMPPLECLACGVSVVIPRGVGMLDELPDELGLHRYKKGDPGDLARALAEAVEARGRVNREALRALTAPYNIGAWCEQHRAAFEALLS